MFLERLDLGLRDAAVAFVAGVYVVGQTMRRQLALVAQDDEVLRGLGLTSVERTLANALPGLITAATSVVVVAGGATLASAWFPIGRARVLEPHPGIHVNYAFVVGGSLLEVLRPHNRRELAAEAAAVQPGGTAEFPLTLAAHDEMVPVIVRATALGTPEGALAGYVGIVVDATSPVTFVHAPGSGGFVRTDRMSTPYWRDRFAGARRVW